MFLVRISAQLLAMHTGKFYCIAAFWWEKLMVDRGEDANGPSRNGIGRGDVEWIGLVQGRDRWRAVAELLASQERL